MSDPFVIRMARRYLRLPVRTGAPQRRVHVSVGGEEVRAFDIELAEDVVDFWVPCDLGPWTGREIALTVDGVEDARPWLERLTQHDAPVDLQGLYREALRPQIHFSSQRGWNNDPNGLVYHEGEYHLFYQHNPYGWSWGNMHWGHAVSRDLVHWEELGDAIYPDPLGTAFSGSAVVDRENTAGFQTDEAPPIVCIYTSAGEPFVQSLAFSNDRGRTVIPYAGNPVVDHIAGENRDPKVIWHAPSAQWVMVLYLDGHEYAILGSPDLKDWRMLQRLTVGTATECPDFFELPVDGDPTQTRWLFWGADGTYLLGEFDGERFTPEGEVLRYDWGGDSYAAQTWSDVPHEDGRRIQIAWLRVSLPGMPFNQCMTFPYELTLRTTPEGVRLFSEPVREVAALRRREHHWERAPLAAGEHALDEVAGELFDIRAEIAPGDALEVGLVIRGVKVRYATADGVLSCAGRRMPMPLVDDLLRLQILVDRTSIEIFGNDGLGALPLGVILGGDDEPVKVYAEGEGALIRALDVFELESIWD